MQHSAALVDVLTGSESATRLIAKNAHFGSLPQKSRRRFVLRGTEVQATSLPWEHRMTPLESSNLDGGLEVSRYLCSLYYP